MSDSDNRQVIGRKSFAAVAINCAAKAGEWIKTKVGGYSTLNHKTSHSDLVTEVDKGSENLIRSLILTHFPDHAVLGEEGVEPGPEASIAAINELKDAEYLWIVDPIDGTTNFVHGFPFFSVSIALAHRGEVILGVVYDPSKDELFIAEKGKGAYVRGRRMQVSREEKLRDSLVATGFPADRDGALLLNMRQLEAVAPRVRNVRTAGSAALHLAYVAAGRLSAFWEIGLNSWDIAAGALLIQESGGVVTDLEGNPYHLGVRDVVASNGAVHDELLKVLRSASAE
ncbi:MAG: inositol monophosphatase [Thermobacillus sp. ZCTH02-B1]|mgnify:CR=1 FL=1|uniref:inositol monophosphatase family protein n=1 Tax=Thermobacillus sp. ZCTH02-B1 TaxID=1858795 RepID=UPI000B57887C|nr:inositol monophosphatase family protein [Thermobacillus sp. ZCTH02-B1]OUM94840.1 MAG: inositol monophosphatase [Thermobacillus sp. ZCTH02-B1]